MTSRSPAAFASLSPRDRCRSLGLVLLLGVAGAATLGCERTRDTSDEPSAAGPLVVYSGRSERLVAPLLERFRAERGVELEVRYAETSQLAATLIEEGEASPAHVFFSQDGVALGAIADRGLATALPSDVLALVPARFADPEARWVGVSGRARTLVYNPERIAEDELPRSLQAITEARYRGRFGVAPTNASFQAHMAVVLALEGEEALTTLLRGLAANQPRSYPSNGAIVEAAIKGEVDFGLVNHYYLYRALAEDPQAPARNFLQPEGVASSFVNVAGVAVVKEHPAALELVRYLLAADAQRYFAEQTFEYPLAGRGEAASGSNLALPSLEQLETPDLDYGAVSELLPRTLELISASGLLG